MATRTAMKACGDVFTEATVLTYSAGRKAGGLYSQKLPSCRMLGVHRARCKGGKIS